MDEPKLFISNMTEIYKANETDEYQFPADSNNTNDFSNFFPKFSQNLNPNLSQDLYYQDENFTITIDCLKASESFVNSTSFKTIVFCLYFAIFCVALLGNGAVCCIVQMTPRMRTVTNYFITNLALGDILMSVFCVPFSSMSTLVLHYWPFGSVLCRIVNYSQVVSVLVSAYTMVALAADRYRAITNPLKPRLSRLAAKSAIGAVWFGALATALPTPIVSTLSKPSEWFTVCRRSICREEWPLREHSYYYSMALMTLQFAVPLSVLVFTYARIAFAVWGGRPPGEAENSRDTRMAKSKRKMVKMMIVVVVVFSMCWLPYNALLLLHDETWEDWWPMPYVFFVSHWLAMSHSCYNPIIYCYMNARFRAGFLQVLCKIPCCSRYAKSRLMFGDAINQSVAGNIPMTGVETTDHMLFRMNTGSTYVSVRRGPGHLMGRNGSTSSQISSGVSRARLGSLPQNNRI